MITARDDTFNICNLFVGQHDLRSVHSDGCDHFKMNDIHNINVMMLFMCIVQGFVWKVFTFASMAYTFMSQTISRIQLFSLCHASQPFLSSGRDAERPDRFAQGSMGKLPEILPLGQELVMTEDTTKHFFRNFGEVAPTKKDFLRIYTAPQSKGDQDHLIKKMAGRDDLLRNMADDDLEEALKIDSPGHVEDLEATIATALDHHFENTFWDKTMQEHFPLTSPWQDELRRQWSMKGAVGTPLHGIQKDDASHQGRHYPQADEVG